MRLETALNLARNGFYIFPCIANQKEPAIKNWPAKATRDAAQITKWFSKHDYNIGISTSHYEDNMALVVVDVDNKNGKDGDTEIFRLEMEGKEFPPTFEQTTPSGGRHLVYGWTNALKQGVNVLGKGLDIRSSGGYIVGPGSVLDGAEYKSNVDWFHPRSPTVAPGWLVDRLGAPKAPSAAKGEVLPGIDADRAERRAIKYLETAPVATEGDGGDLATFKVACKLKDFGCDELQAAVLMMTHWNDRCSPPWEPDEMETKVHHAYRYGQEPRGAAAPEAQFPPIPETEPSKSGTKSAKPETLHPFAEMNKEFAFVKKGAFVLQETTDDTDQFVTEHLNMAEFHGWFANKMFAAANSKPKPLSECWLAWSQRREYEAVVFRPQENCGPRWYNLWRGFSVAPAATADHPAVAAFCEHALVNVCGGDEMLCNWLLGYFAHMIQKPWEKPLVALVFKGKKGTGKNALVERVGQLFASHFLVADDERYLLSNFNSHLESNLFFVLDEASWAGDKRAEGKLKGLITGQHHNIERKGKEAYKVKNLTRVAIIGNEDWLVPASADERRFAVFNVGDGRRQDRKFFEDMRTGMEQGGYAHLLKFLQDFDLGAVDVNDAPNTVGLMEQKIASLEPLEQWWYGCLEAGQVLCGDFGSDWPERLSINRLHDALERYYKKRNIKSRAPDRNALSRKLKAMAQHYIKKKNIKRELGDGTYAYFHAGIDQLRSDFDAYMGDTLEWDEL